MDNILGILGPKTEEEAIAKIDELETRALRFMELAQKNGCYKVWNSGPMKAAEFLIDQANSLRAKFNIYV